MTFKNTLISGLSALAIAGCASTAKQPCDNFGKIDDYRDHWDFIEKYGWAVNTIKPINGVMLKAPGIPKVYVISKGAESLRGYAWVFYRDPDMWMYFTHQNPELIGYAPNETLPIGVKIPAQMLEWQILGFEKEYDRQIVPQDSASGELFKYLKRK
ncbi:hypothetical protein HYT23_05455 [Candidatus Pacearchaeota archaeon]|nr:hypothetical protein [Candidatus Pacearchaeota archaeon]